MTEVGALPMIVTPSPTTTTPPHPDHPRPLAIDGVETSCILFASVLRFVAKANQGKFVSTACVF